MGCYSCSKCILLPDQEDDVSIKSVSIEIISPSVETISLKSDPVMNISPSVEIFSLKPHPVETITPITLSGESTLSTDKTPSIRGVSSIECDAAKWVSKNVFTSHFSNTMFSTINSINGRAFSDDLSLTEITSQLYLGSFEDAKKEAKVVELGITHILSLIGPKHPINGIKHMHQPMDDNGHTNLKSLIKRIWSFVMDSQQPGNKLFVHCMGGQNRSATVMISVLMKLKPESSKLVDVYNLVKDKRPVVQINQLYAKQLLELERDLFGTTTMSPDWMKIRSYDMQTGSVVFCD